MTFEKITASTLRGALHEPILINTVGQGITLDCLQGCKDLGPQCPSMIVDYGNNKCFRLDRGTQGRDSDIIAFPSHSYFEQICLRGKEDGTDLISKLQIRYSLRQRLID